MAEEFRKAEVKDGTAGANGQLAERFGLTQGVETEINGLQAADGRLRSEELIAALDRNEHTVPATGAKEVLVNPEVQARLATLFANVKDGFEDATADLPSVKKQAILDEFKKYVNELTFGDDETTEETGAEEGFEAEEPEKEAPAVEEEPEVQVFK